MTRARFVSRDNRFVVRARLDQGDDEIRCYLPNTARLTDVLVTGAPLVVVANDDPGRRTRWTVTRVWDGTWVALAASVAADLVHDHLAGGGALPGWPPANGVRREVTHGRHRFDLEVDLADGTAAVVEVKSLSRVLDGVAPLSGTPSTRGVAHLDALAAMTAEGGRTAVVFVVQRDDAEVLDIAAEADDAWVDAVRRAHDAGVDVVAYSCTVGEETLHLAAPLPVRDDRPGRPARRDQ